MRLFVIVNPASGGGKSGGRVPEIEAALRAGGLDYTLRRTERAGQAADLAEQAAREGYEIVVTAGGDGTANEAINGLMKARAAGFDRTALSMFSIGTGNDFAGSLGLSTDPRQVAQALKSGARQWIDIGWVKGGDHPAGRYFGNCAGVGFDAAGTIQAKKINKRASWLRGTLLYLVSVLQTIFIYFKAPTLKIEFDGEEVTQPSLMVSVMNGRRIGGSFWMAPEAKFDDGLFDICIARQVTRLRMLGLISHFLKGTQGTQPEIRMARAAKVRITAVKGGIPAHIDGEIISEDGREMEIEIRPRQIQIAGVGQA